MASTIPLHCNICPKKPNFSDVSHLLTHIASKGHLSNYYKMKVRSSSEETSRRLVEAYDQWYAEWNVEDLMSERMNQKDKRRTRARPAARLPPAPPRIEAPAPRLARPRVGAGGLLDPRLSEHHTIKTEKSVTPTPTAQPGPVLRHRPFAQRLQYWPTDSRSTSHSYTNQDYDTSSDYSEPSRRKQHYRYNPEDSCAIEDDQADADTLTTVDSMAVNESTRLKGVLWPGMDIFDSATPEMRRKRNQKKDSSVLEQLQLNSLDVEANELIFTPQGSFKKQRRISSSEYDDDGESSPIRRDSPRPALTRPALASLDANTRRRPRQSTRPPPFSYLPRAQYNGSHRAEYPYGIGDQAPRAKRSFDVFQDDEISFAQPAAFNYLTAGFHRHQPPPTPTPALGSFKAYNDPYQFDKDNVNPAYQQTTFDPTGRLNGGYPHSAYGYGIGHDPHAFQFQNHLYMNNAYQQNHDDADDQRTLTAPPSPSTG